MKVLICVNPYKDKELKVCKKICEFFDEKNVHFFVFSIIIVIFVTKLVTKSVAKIVIII